MSVKMAQFSLARALRLRVYANRHGLITGFAGKTITLQVPAERAVARTGA
jgi:hypothetical protein